MGQFINARDSIVTESIDGMLRAAGHAALARLDGYPHIKVVCRTDHKPSKVAVISGGGSGHEPAHAGFVGKGMLTAAVCGEVFASPSVDAVLAAILAVTGKAGCLLIVKNYTGDRLNFGLAAERARLLGRKVEVVIVADDIAIPGISQPRGVAGTLFVHKIAGHFAEKGAGLAVVAAMAREAAAATVSLGISLSSCTLPGIGREDRVPKGKAEVGLGIHGEPGVDLIGFEGARQAADLMVRKLFGGVRRASGYALLLNNLGSTTPLEMGVLAHEFLGAPRARKIKLAIGPAPLMTSLDMHGFSASLLPLTRDFAAALASPVAPVAWPGATPVGKLQRIKLPKDLRRQRPKPSRDAALRSLVERCCDLLAGLEDELNGLDQKVGDGDTGSTIATGARSLKGKLGALPLDSLGGFFSATSGVLSTSMGGSSGVLLAILFAAAGATAEAGAPWPKALQAGLNRMMEYGGAGPGDRTMVDALEPALAALAAGKTLSEAAAAARQGADATAKMQRARAGRSAYVSAANLSGVPDPGAVAVARLFEGLAGG
ncbi:MAG: dihydroxyacetone kinase subunit DhaK [Rhizobiales bacterium]|nr:dihydroxyacetone kinase subunit DhaK [Hyphomicrobiales bacterium]MBI3671908.1 dihydroxyacetone kinase subunit DhaK [Hyphomicrobiales bacterium]